MAKNTAVFGLYPSRTAIESAVTNLRNAGFRSTDISLLLPENMGSKDLAVEKSSKASEGAAAGAGTGAVVGGAVGWLAGIGALTIPGVGPFLAVGPIVAALAGAGAVGAVGGVAGAMVGMGIPEYEAKRFDGRIRKGGLLLSVHADDANWVKKAHEILQRTGAEDVSSSAEAGSDYAKSDKPLPRMSTGGEGLEA